MLHILDLNKIPNEFLCSITLDLMKDPVTASDGYSYERTAIEAWFRNGKSTSPRTGLALINTHLIPNIPLRNLIREYQEQTRSEIAPQLTTAVALIDVNNRTLEVEKNLREQVLQAQEEQKRLRQQLASSARFFNSLPLSNHEELMRKLAKDLDVEYGVVCSGVAVEQTLVAFAGIYTRQEGANYRRNDDGTTSFKLKFGNEEECRQLVRFYQEHFVDFITSYENIVEGEYKLIINTRQLFNQVSLALGHFRREGHKELMQKFAADLGVTWNEVYSGSVVEQTLVRITGIETNQNQASYRRNPINQATYFNLMFANQEEYNHFIAYYNNHFPGLILNSCYVEHELSRIEMNTNILYNQISSALGEFVHRLIPAKNIP